MENLVIEGGGSKAYSFIGVLQHLEKIDSAKDIKNIIGVSAGSMMASLLAVGCSSEKIIEIYNAFDFSKYTIKYTNIFTYWNIFNHKGINDSSVFKEQVVNNMLFLACGDGDITFKQLFDLYKKVLVISGSCVNRRESHYYHVYSNPNMKIKDAITISCCIPFVFTPVLWNEDTLVDGGLIENYPLYFFDRVKLPDSRKEKVFNTGTPLNPKTFGIKFVSKSTKKDQTLYGGNDDTKSFINYLKSLVSTLLTSNEREYIRENYWEQTISVNVDELNGIESLALSNEQKLLLITAGNKACFDFFEKKA